MHPIGGERKRRSSESFSKLRTLGKLFPLAQFFTHGLICSSVYEPLATIPTRHYFLLIARRQSSVLWNVPWSIMRAPDSKLRCAHNISGKPRRILPWPTSASGVLSKIQGGSLFPVCPLNFSNRQFFLEPVSTSPPS
jgi:hypothetical protein